MKIHTIAWLIVASLTFLRSASGQDFRNLDFEAAQVTGPNYPTEIDAGNALPGWTVFYGTNQQTQVYYNLFFLGVSLMASNNLVISGNFSVMLVSGTPANSISQTGLVPLGTESLLFEAQSPYVKEGFHEFLSVALGGQDLPFFGISTNANYALYGADISAFAGRLKH